MAIDASQDQLNKANTSTTNASQQTPSMGQSLGGAGNATGATQPVGAGSGRVASYSSGIQPQQGSGRFTNLQNYINANQGAGEQLGQRVTGNVQNQVNKASDTSQAAQIGQQINAEKNRLSEGQQFNQQLQNSPTDITQNQDSVNRFQALLKNQNQLGNIQSNAQAAQQQQVGQISSAGQNVSNLGSEQGRYNLLQNTVNQPGYSTGQQRLDQLFMQTQNPNNLIQAQRNLGNQLNTAQNNLNTTYGSYNSDIGNLGTQAANVASQLGSTLTGQQQDIQTKETQAATAANDQASMKNAALDLFNKGNYSSLTPEQQGFINLQLGQGGLVAGQRMYNINPDQAQYETKGSTTNTAQNMITQPDFEKYSALAQLAGLTPEQMAFKQAGAGGAQAGINAQQLSTDINTAQQNLADKLNKTVSGSSGLLGVTGTANYSDLLKNYTNPQADLNPYIQTNVQQVLSGWNPNDPVAAGVINQINKDNSAFKQNTIQDFMNQLNAAGYNNTLGGVAGVTKVD